MARKFEFNLVKVEIKNTTYNGSHEPAVVQTAQPATIPSRTGWLLWVARIAKVTVFGVRVYMALHGVEPDPVGLAMLGYSIIAEVKTWIVERFTK